MVKGFVFLTLSVALQGLLNQKYKQIQKNAIIPPN